MDNNIFFKIKNRFVNISDDNTDISAINNIKTKKIDYEYGIFSKRTLIKNTYKTTWFKDDIDDENFIFYKSFFKRKIYKFKRIPKRSKKEIYRTFSSIDSIINWRIRSYYFPIIFSSQKYFFFWKSPNNAINKKIFTKIPFFSKFIKIRNDKLNSIQQKSIRSFKKKKKDQFNIYFKNFSTRFNANYTFSTSNLFASPIKNKNFTTYRLSSNIIFDIKGNVKDEHLTGKSYLDIQRNWFIKYFFFLKIVNNFKNYLNQTKVFNQTKVSPKIDYSFIWYKYNNFIKFSINKKKHCKYYFFINNKNSKFNQTTTCSFKKKYFINKNTKNKFKVWDFNKKIWTKSKSLWYWDSPTKIIKNSRKQVEKNKIIFNNFKKKIIFTKISKFIIKKMNSCNYSINTDIFKMNIFKIINYINFKNKIKNQNTFCALETIYKNNPIFVKKFSAFDKNKLTANSVQQIKKACLVRNFISNDELWDPVKRNIFYQERVNIFKKYNIMIFLHYDCYPEKYKNFMKPYRGYNNNALIVTAAINKIFFTYFYSTQNFKFIQSMNLFKFIKNKALQENNQIKNFLYNCYTSNNSEDFSKSIWNYELFINSKAEKESFFETEYFLELPEFDQQIEIMKEKIEQSIYEKRLVTDSININKKKFNKFINGRFFWSIIPNYSAKLFRIFFTICFFFITQSKNSRFYIYQNSFFKKMLGCSGSSFSTITDNFYKVNRVFFNGDADVMDKKIWDESYLSKYDTTPGEYFEFKIFDDENPRKWLKIVMLNRVLNSIVCYKLMKINQYLPKQSVQIIIKPLRNNFYCTIIPYIYNKNYKKQIFNKSAGDLCKVKGYFRRSLQVRRNLYNAALLALMRFGNKVTRYQFSIFRPKMFFETISTNTNPNKRSLQFKNSFNEFFKTQSQKRFPTISIEPIHSGLVFGEPNRGPKRRRRRHKRKPKWLAY